MTVLKKCVNYLQRTSSGGGRDAQEMHSQMTDYPRLFQRFVFRLLKLAPLIHSGNLVRGKSPLTSKDRNAHIATCEARFLRCVQNEQRDQEEKREARDVFTKQRSSCAFFLAASSSFSTGSPSNSLLASTHTTAHQLLLVMQASISSCHDAHFFSHKGSSQHTSIIFCLGGVMQFPLSISSNTIRA